MASQNHETGFTTYFQPMATGYHKVFNTLDGNFWCCTGTGYENFTKLQRGIYYKEEGKLLIALYLSSELVTDSYRVVQECDLTNCEKIKITVTPNVDCKITNDIYLRIPEWAKSYPEVCVNGKAMDEDEKALGGFIVIPGALLADGGQIEITLPMGLHYENLPDGKNTYAFLYGPYLLSARLGTAKMKTKFHGVQVSVPAERAVENDDVKITDGITVEDFLKNLDSHLVRRPGTMEFDLNGTDRDLVFTTHYNQYKECYGIYWTFK